MRDLSIAVAETDVAVEGRRAEPDRPPLLACCRPPARMYVVALVRGSWQRASRTPGLRVCCRNINDLPAHPGAGD